MSPLACDIGRRMLDDTKFESEPAAVKDDDEGEESKKEETRARVLKRDLHAKTERSTSMLMLCTVVFTA